MDKENIIKLINKKHDLLYAWLDSYGKEYWEYGPEGKWTTGENIIHLVQSLKPLNKALHLPKMVIKLKFGQSNRSIGGYDYVVRRYLKKLEGKKNLVSPFSKDMVNPELQYMNGHISDLKKEQRTLVDTIHKKWTNKNLATYILPHPAMGKTPIAEMCMWVASHTEHHLNIIRTRMESSHLQ